VIPRELTLEHLRAAGRTEYLVLYFAEHFLGQERFARWLGSARQRNERRMLDYFKDWPTDQRRPVREVAFTTHDAFYRSGPDWEPAVFRGVAKHWPAVQKWNLEFFIRNYGDTTAVLIDQQGLYGEGEKGRYMVSNMGALLSSIRDGKREALRFLPTIDDNPELKLDLDMQWFGGFRSQFALREFTQFFLAPPSTFTPVHCAHESNAFLQVHGRKRWLLWPARHQQLIQPPSDRKPYFHSNYYPGRDTGAPKLGAYAPAFEVVLDPGDVLYVPPFVWHCVENLDTTIAVAYRFFSMRCAFRSSLAMTAVKLMATRPSILHNLVCPRRSATKRCSTPGCPFAIEQTAAEAA
jgi:Cupin-like domain